FGYRASNAYSAYTLLSCPQSDHDLRGDSATGYQQSCSKPAESESIILTAHTRSPARCDRVRQWSSWSAMVWSCWRPEVNDKMAQSCQLKLVRANDDPNVHYCL